MDEARKFQVEKTVTLFCTDSRRQNLMPQDGHDRLIISVVDPDHSQVILRFAGYSRSEEVNKEVVISLQEFKDIVDVLLGDAAWL